MHQRVMIFYPGGVSYGALPTDASDEEAYDMLYTAATIEEGNGDGRIRRRKRKEAINDGTSIKSR